MIYNYSDVNFLIGGSILLNRVKFCLIIICVFFFSTGSASADTVRFDVAVVGAGSGGCAAAIQAARMGASVALIDETDWLGGQMTAAAVSTMDDKTFTRTGIYGEFIGNVRDFYSVWGRNVNVCYWGSDTIAFEPWAGRKILLDMISKSGNIVFYQNTKPVSAKVSSGKLQSAVFVSNGKEFTVSASVFIDATECGDFIPLTGAKYRSGNSISPKIDKQSVIQDITYVAVIRKYPDGLPEELKVTTPPPGYSDYLFDFRAMFRIDGNMWPGEYPFNVPSHNAYRAVPDPSNSAVIDGGNPDTWALITKTSINWANDYPGKKNEMGGLSVQFLESPAYRRDIERAAMAKTLCFIYYMQNELGMKDWSVDNREGYGSYFTNKWQEWDEMPERYGAVLKHFPPYPYVRESRRIVGVKSMVVTDIIRDDELKRTRKSISDSIALGEYPIDIHGAQAIKYLDKDLAERAEDIPTDWQGEGGLFQIPMGALIPAKLDGLLAAEKNISVSRIVNGSTRLQPVTMLTGQAVGALAALSVQKKTEPRKVRVIDVQAALLKAKSQLSLRKFEDVPDYSTSWPGVEASMLYGYMDADSENIYGVYNEMHWIEVKDAFKRALHTKKFPERDLTAPLTVGEFKTWLRELYKKDIKNYEDIIDYMTDEDKPLTKGRLALTIFNIMKAAPEKDGK